MLPISSIAASGLTLELWFNARASGVLVGQWVNGASSYLAPLLFVDGQGLLAGGLFDSTTLELMSPPQTIIVSLDSNQQPVVGAASHLATPMSVVDGDWHHAALVVAPGRQSLYLDGRLVDTATGSFGLDFTDSTGQSYTPSNNTQIGGSIIPMPQSTPLLPFSYPQGFEGLIDELRIWSVPRTAGELQQLMLTPLSAPLPNGLFGYYPFDNDGPTAPSLPSSYAQLVPSTVPFDPFPQLANRLPGCQNYGIQLATPFASPVVQIDFGATPTYSVKVGLKQGDRLQIGLPNTDTSQHVLDGTFSLAATSGVTNQTLPPSSFSPGDSAFVTADYTGVYQLDLSYTEPITADISFMLLSGPGNIFMQLLLSFPGDDPFVPLMAYSDPCYPTTITPVSDPRPGETGTINLPAYWPLFSDTTAFGNTFDPDALLGAYLDLVQNTPSRLDDGSSFADYFNLTANYASAVTPSALQAGLLAAYQAATNNQAPPALPQNPPASTYGPGPYNSAIDQVYTFIYNANFLRQTLASFLDTYKGWVGVNPDMLMGSAIPGEIANLIYLQQGQPAPRSVSHLNGGGLAINLIAGALLWGLGAVIAPVFGITAVAATAAVSFAGSAGASITSELIGTFVSSSSTRLVQPPNLNSYTSLIDVVKKIQSDFDSIWGAAEGHLENIGFLQAAYSNYGLLQAFQVISAANLSKDQFDDPSLGASSPLIQGITYASWQRLVPAIFSWQCAPYKHPSNPNINISDFTPFKDMGVFLPIAQSNYTPYASEPMELNSVFFSQDVPTLQQMLYELQLLQGGKQTSAQTWQSLAPGAFFCATPCVCVSIMDGFNGGGVLQQWYLEDCNSKPMDASLTKSLFGIGSAAVTLSSFAEQGSVFAAWGGAWYWNTLPPPGAQTTWFDAFANWGASASDFAPAALTNPSSYYMYTKQSGLWNRGAADWPATWSGPPQLMRIAPQGGAQLLSTVPLIGGQAVGLDSTQVFVRGRNTPASGDMRYLYMLVYDPQNDIWGYDGLSYSYRLASDPVLVMNKSTSQPTLTQHLYGVDTNGHLQETAFVPGNPGSLKTTALGGAALAGTPAVGGTPGGLQLFIRDQSGDLIVFVQTGDSWPYDNISQAVKASAPAGTVVTISGTPVVLDNVYAIGGDSSLLIFSYTTGWSVKAASFTPALTATLQGILVGFLDSQGAAQLFVSMSDGTLRRLFNTSGTWQSQTLPAAGTIAASGAALTQGAPATGPTDVYAINNLGQMLRFTNDDGTLETWTCTTLLDQVGNLLFDNVPLVIAGDDGPFIFAVTRIESVWSNLDDALGERTGSEALASTPAEPAATRPTGLETAPDGPRGPGRLVLLGVIGVLMLLVAWLIRRLRR
jgi:hypothetical protein